MALRLTIALVDIFPTESPIVKLSITAAHAKGHLTKGTFIPSAEAASLSKAPHFSNSSTPVIARFSSSTGIRDLPDTDGQGNPRGFGLRFVLSDDGHMHTDIIAHSTPFFPARTGEDFLALLGAIGGGTVGEFLEQNPAAKAFVTAPKPFPVSFATEKYFGVNAFKLINKDGKETFVRYRVTPDAGYEVLDDSDVLSKSKDYLFEEIKARLSNSSASFKLLAQIAEDGDPTNDATKHWPEDRKQVELGTIKIDTFEEDKESKKDQQRIIFDPVPRVDGVEASDDPIIEMRAALYLISGKERRAAAPSA